VDHARDRAGDRLGIVVLEDRPADRDARRARVHRAPDVYERCVIPLGFAARDHDREPGGLDHVLEALCIPRVAGLDHVGSQLLAQPDRVSEAFGVGLVDAGPAGVRHREQRDPELVGASR
jgi:hypothetical protein